MARDVQKGGESGANPILLLGQFIRDNVHESMDKLCD